MHTELMKLKIIRFFDMSDSGEYGNAVCPHCGALGRYVYRFQLEDGSNHGAMAGCIKKFKVHPIAKVQLKLMDKEKEYQKKGWNLPSWDRNIVEALDKYYANEIDANECQWIINKENQRAADYRNKKR